MWPAAVLVEALLDVLGGALAFRLLDGRSWSAAVRSAVSLAHEQILGGPVWWAMLAVFVLWPCVAGSWPRVWGWRGREHGAFSPAVHAAAALLPAVVLLLGLLPAPDVPEGRQEPAPPSARGPSAGAGDLPSPCPARGAPSAPARPPGLPVPELPTEADAGPAAPPASGVFTTVRVRSVRPVTGTLAQAQDAADRLSRARWTLGADGTLTADGDQAPDLRTTAVRGAARLLSGERTRTTDVSATTAWVDARLDTPADGPPVLRLTYAATGATRAVVACEEFTSVVTSAARIELELARE